MMHKVHMCINRRWKFIYLNDEVFNALSEINIIRYVNCVYALSSHDKNNRMIVVNIPNEQDFTLADFTTVDENGKSICVL